MNGVDGRVQFIFVKVSVSLESGRHDTFSEGHGSSVLANAFDGTLQLAGAIEVFRQAVDAGRAEVVLAVFREDDTIGAGHVLAEFGDEASALPWHLPSRGVGDIDGGGAGLNDGPEDAVNNLGVEPPSVFQAKLNVVASQAFGKGHGIHGGLDDLVGHLVEFGLRVHLGGGDKGVDTGAPGALDGVPGALNVLQVSYAHAGNHGDVSVVTDLVADDISDLLDGGEVVR